MFLPCGERNDELHEEQHPFASGTINVSTSKSTATGCIATASLMVYVGKSPLIMCLPYDMDNYSLMDYMMIL